ncbi:MAG: hypothetical protein KBC17_04085 [Candidatus Pacebacteria bacterium]|nr:hypothetical protein [Candidatus Paceibacterota bacterium]
MTGLLLSALEVFLFFLFFSSQIIGRSPDEVFERKKPWEYYSRMFRAIVKICPRQTYTRLGYISLEVIGVYLVMTASFRFGNEFLFTDILNLILFLIALLFFNHARKHSKVKEKWVHLRILAHQKAYKKRPRLTKYGSLEQVFGVKLRQKKKEKTREFIEEPE